MDTRGLLSGSIVKGAMVSSTFQMSESQNSSQTQGSF